MLCQLVCTDRRYARMNCFNIRELQSILKNKFFTDLVNSHDHRDLLNSSMIGLRFKQNLNINLDLDITSFYKYGLHSNNLNKTFTFNNNASLNNVSLITNWEFLFLRTFTFSFYSFILNFAQLIRLAYTEGRDIFFTVLFPSAYHDVNVENLSKSFSYNFSSLWSGFGFYTFNESVVSTTNAHILNTTLLSNPDQYTIFTENSSNQRVTRFNTVFVNYDYKTGHYLGNWDSLYPYLLNSFVEVAKGIKKPCWYFSDKYIDLCQQNYTKFFNTFTGKANLKLPSQDMWYVSHVTPLDNINNFYFSTFKYKEYTNIRWQSFLNLDQNFKKMFLSSTTQQRVLANW
jgi:hypothetical protein